MNSKAAADSTSYYLKNGAALCAPRRQQRNTGRWLVALGVAAMLVLRPGIGGAAEAPPAKVDETNSQEVLRAYLQLQEQLHASQLAIEQNRREWKESAAQNEEALGQRLRGIEQALAAQRSRELDAMQNSNRVMLIVAGSFAGVGFLAMVIMAYFQWRTVSGLAEITAGLPSARALPPGHLLALDTGEAGSLAAQQSNARLLGALGQIEKRLYELEHATVHEVEATKNGNGHEAAVEPLNGTAKAPEPTMPGGKGIRDLLTKGDTLLDQNNAEAALTCFEEALAIAPADAEALVKKGTALERLQKLDEAIACYDHAIATDGSLTIAYLHKGGLCNRLERFNEALECYEKALQTQEKRQR